MHPPPAPQTEEETLAAVSADLPCELQSKMFDQLAAIGLGGAGLTITLVGSLLKDAPFFIWFAAIEFGLAALIALIAQVHLIDGLFRRTPIQKRSRLMTAIAVMLIGMGVGSLATSVFLEGKKDAKHEAAAKPTP